MCLRTLILVSRINYHAGFVIDRAQIKISAKVLAIVSLFLDPCRQVFINTLIWLRLFSCPSHLTMRVVSRKANMKKLCH
jgi:hypothetical protein